MTVMVKIGCLDLILTVTLTYNPFFLAPVHFLLEFPERGESFGSEYSVEECLADTGGRVDVRTGKGDVIFSFTQLDRVCLLQCQDQTFAPMSQGASLVNKCF